MSNNILFGLLSAFWLGILTSISPCPLATNIAATSYVGKKIGDKKSVLLSGLLYGAGRIVTYVIIGVILVAGFSSSMTVSLFLQKYMNKMLGPVLIIVGMFLLELLSLDFGGNKITEKISKRAESGGLWGAALLGVVFALSFCPVSAALFFGSLIPLSIKFGSKFLMPFIYGLGTGLPVIIFAFLLAFSAQSVGKAFNKISIFEYWARRITGVIFILAGIYYILIYIF